MQLPMLLGLICILKYNLVLAFQLVLSLDIIMLFIKENTWVHVSAKTLSKCKKFK